MNAYGCTFDKIVDKNTFAFFGYLNSINSVNFKHTKATRLIAILYSDKIVCCIHILTNHPKMLHNLII